MPAAKSITAEELASSVGRDGKTVRAFLRKNFARKADSKGNRWEITPAVAKAVRAHYAKLDSAGETEAQAS